MININIDTRIINIDYNIFQILKAAMKCFNFITMCYFCLYAYTILRVEKMH